MGLQLDLLGLTQSPLTARQANALKRIFAENSLHPEFVDQIAAPDPNPLKEAFGLMMARLGSGYKPEAGKADIIEQAAAILEKAYPKEDAASMAGRLFNIVIS